MAFCSEIQWFGLCLRCPKRRRRGLVGFAWRGFGPSGLAFDAQRAAAAALFLGGIATLFVIAIDALQQPAPVHRARCYQDRGVASARARYSHDRGRARRYADRHSGRTRDRRRGGAHRCCCAFVRVRTNVHSRRRERRRDVRAGRFAACLDRAQTQCGAGSACAAERRRVVRGR